MIAVAIFAVFAVAYVQGQVPLDYRYNTIYDETPKPYSFNYNAPLEDGVGQSSRTESADGSGRVQGSYTVNNDEGHYRVVEYIADENGFRAVVRTNEPGTDNQSPADVTVQSEAGPAPYQYTQGIRQPVVIQPATGAAQPVEIVPENVLAPVRRPLYRRPENYAVRNYAARNYEARNYAYRPANRYVYNAA